MWGWMKANPQPAVTAIAAFVATAIALVSLRTARAAMRATTAAQAQWVTINRWECQPGFTIDEGVPAYVHVSFACSNKTKAPFYVKRVEFFANGSYFPYVVDRELLPDESTDIDVAVSLSLTLHDQHLRRRFRRMQLDRFLRAARDFRPFSGPS